MPTLLDNLLARLDEADAASALASRIDGDRTAVDVALGPALARVIDGLARLAADRHGALVVGGLVDRPADEGGAGPGNVILDRVFGAERGLVVIGLASGLGLAPSLVGRLLPLVTPFVTAELADRRRVASLDDGQVAELLTVERGRIAAAGILAGTSFADSGLGVARPRAGRSPAAGRRSGRHRAGPAGAGLATIEVTQPLPVVVPVDPDEEPPPGPSDAAPLDPGTVDPGTVDPGTVDPGTVDPEPVDIEQIDTEPIDAATLGSVAIDIATVDAATVETDQVAADPGLAEAVVEARSVAPIADRRRGGSVTGPEVDDGPGAHPAIGEPAIREDADDRPVLRLSDEAPIISAPLVAPAGPAPAQQPVDARGTALAWLGWAVGSVVLVLLLAWLLSTCAGGRAAPGGAPTVVGLGPAGGDAPITDAVGPAAEGTADDDVESMAPAGAELTPVPDVAASVAATLIGTGIDGLADGGHVVLTGSVADEAARAELEARIGTLLGVESIDNRITVVPPLVDPSTDGLVAPGPDPIEGPANPAGSTLNEALDLAPIAFASKSAELTDEGRAIVDRVARYLHRHPELLISIDGHTDADGDAEANLELSQQRADAVLARLLELSVEPERVIAVGHGEAVPAFPNDSLDNKAANRRIEFTVR